MPYVRCGNCGLSSYTAPPHMFAADCPVCGRQLLPAGLAAGRERPSLTERHAAARVAFRAPLDGEAVRE